jgi:PST family polysaccharide transporter
MHTAALSVLNKNSLLAVYQFINVAFFAICVAVLVRFFGIKGYGLAELAALACYAILHLFVAKQVGSPDYRLTALWWSAAALGLFWHQLGVWTIALPFVVLLLPISLRRVTSVAQQMQAAFFKKKAPAA